MHESPSLHTSPYFKPLEQSAFQSMQHAASLKGLLKPFKGKRALKEWGSQCEELRDQLIQLSSHEILPQMKIYPLALLQIILVQQTTSAGTSFLRWCTRDRSKMGVHLWNELLSNQQTPQHLIDDLYALEMQRIVLNMQISLVHTIYRQAQECLKKMEDAQTLYLKRLN